MLAERDYERLREARPGDAFRPLSPSVWEDRLPPRRDWLIEKCVVRGTVALVSGDGGVGKSLICQQLCTAAALGRPWLGQTVAAGRSLFLACEDDQDELWRRQYDINRSMDATMTDVSEAGFWLMPRVGHDNTLSRLDRKTWTMVVTELFQRLLGWCLEAGITYVVIDTATQTFAGNQVDEQQVVQFINQLRRLAIAIQGAVIITKHPSLSGRALGTGESGSTAWHNSVRSRLYLHRDNSGLFLSAKKSNYGPADLKLPVRWERGVFVKDEVDTGPPPSYGYKD